MSRRNISDNCQDHRTYRKTDIPVTNKNLTKVYDNIYAKYGNVVGVNTIDEKFKNIVNEFRKEFEVPAMKRPSGIVKEQWMSYYRRNK